MQAQQVPQPLADPYIPNGIFLSPKSTSMLFLGCNVVKINNLIYAQCVTYIDSEEEKTLDHDVWTGGKPSEGGGSASGGPREGAAHHPMWAGLYICRRQSNSLYRRKPNTT
jgi:hypothetical protein